MIIEAIITSLFCIGLYYSTSYENDKFGKPIEKNILWFVRYYVQKWIGEPYGKPFILCPQCMASFWGVVFYVVVFHHRIGGIDDFGHVCIFVFVVSALNKLIQTTIER